MGNFPECEEYKSDKKIVLQENKSKFIIENPNTLEVLIITVDNCAIKIGSRCDYMIIPEPKKHDLEIYLELKGNKIAQGVVQLEATIEQLSNNAQKKSKKCFIVCTHCPSNKITNTKISQFKQEFKKKYNALLQVKTTPFEFKLQ